MNGIKKLRNLLADMVVWSMRFRVRKIYSSDDFLARFRPHREEAQP